MKYPILRIAQSTLHSLAGMFNQTPSRVLGEASSHVTINARRLFVHKHPLLSIARYSLIQLSELEHYRVKKTCQWFEDLNLDSFGQGSRRWPLHYYKIVTSRLGLSGTMKLFYQCKSSVFIFMLI